MRITKDFINSIRGESSVCIETSDQFHSRVIYHESTTESTCPYLLSAVYEDTSYKVVAQSIMLDDPSASDVSRVDAVTC